MKTIKKISSLTFKAKSKDEKVINIEMKDFVLMKTTTLFDKFVEYSYDEEKINSKVLMTDIIHTCTLFMHLVNEHSRFDLGLNSAPDIIIYEVLDSVFNKLDILEYSNNFKIKMAIEYEDGSLNEEFILIDKKEDSDYVYTSINGYADFEFFKGFTAVDIALFNQEKIKAVLSRIKHNDKVFCFSKKEMADLNVSFLDLSLLMKVWVLTNRPKSIEDRLNVEDLSKKLSIIKLSDTYKNLKKQYSQEYLDFDENDDFKLKCCFYNNDSDKKIICIQDAFSIPGFYNNEDNANLVFIVSSCNLLFQLLNGHLSLNPEKYFDIMAKNKNNQKNTNEFI